MRIDLFLKTSRLIKRRKVAHDAITNNLILVNDVIVKPSYQVKINDVIILKLGLKEITVKVLSLKPNKDELMYELINEQYLGQRN
ncbi:MAG TPA: RNA-binding S4 domain-containing protein [Acholeplasma sp.]|nr:RNA-binding S4 domain-containing protein [Acholeplasma sp.]